MAIGNGGTVPDVNGKWMAAAAAATTILVWIVGLFGVTMPPEVASSLTTLLVVVAGVIGGDTAGARDQNRRAGDQASARGE